MLKKAMAPAESQYGIGVASKLIPVAYGNPSPPPKTYYDSDPVETGNEVILTQYLPYFMLQSIIKVCFDDRNAMKLTMSIDANIERE